MIENQNLKPKYKSLYALKRLLFLSHGNSEPERSFSFNKHMIGIYGTSIEESIYLNQSVLLKKIM